MGEGLKLVVGADFKQAEKALKDFTGTAGKEGAKAGSALAAGLNKAIPPLQKIPAAAKPAIQKISELGKSVEALQFAIADRKAELIRTVDIQRAAVLNTEIKQLEAEIKRINSAGLTGFDQMGNQLTKTAGGFQAVTSGAQKTFSALRFVANIVPGIGLAGLIGLLSETVVGLFQASQGLDEAAISAAKFSLEIKNAKEGLEQFVGSLDFETDIKKLQNKLKFGDTEQTDLLNLNVDKERNNKVIDLANTQISEIINRIGQLQKNASFVLSKNGKDLLNNFFGSEVDIPDNLIDDLKKSDRDILREIKVAATKQKELEELRKNAFIANEKSTLEAQIKINEKRKKLAEDNFRETIEQAKKLAAFLDKNTQFAVNFEVDPFDTEAQTFGKAKDFIAKARSFIEKQTPEFHFKPIVLTDFSLKFDKKIIENIKEQAGIEATRTYKEVKKSFEDEIKRRAEADPLVANVTAEVNAAIKNFDANQKNLGAALGLNIKDSNAVGALSKMQQQAIATANTVNSVLQPAFDGLFAAIKAGENPVKAFFQSLGQALLQLLQKIIAAAIQAAILSAIFTGGIGTGAGAVKGFGGFFKNIMGFASGGLVSGPTLGLVGEGFGTSRSNPEVIAPLDQLRGMLSGLMGEGGGGPVMVWGDVRNNRLRLLGKRADKQARRLQG